MDLEYLEIRYRDSLQRAMSAATESARLSHEGVARFYADWIDAEKLRRAAPPTE